MTKLIIANSHSDSAVSLANKISQALEGASVDYVLVWASPDELQVWHEQRHCIVTDLADDDD